MRVLVGSTGFVGSTLAGQTSFDVQVHRPNVSQLAGTSADLLVCAGLPAVKWQANAEPEQDLANMNLLIDVLDSMRIDQIVLVSTVDVFQPPVDCDEDTQPAADGSQAYGRHRAQFESFVRERFERSLILRLPGLFGPGLRKNLIYDLLEGRLDQVAGVNRDSSFQFVDVRETWPLAERALDAGLAILNVATEPVRSQAIADLFGAELSTDGPVLRYDMHSRFAREISNRPGPYLASAADQIQAITKLRDHWTPGGTS